MKPFFLLIALAFWFAGLPSAHAADQPFFFVQLSDPQMGMFSNNADFTQDAANFEFAVAAINRLRPAFVVITGDLVNKPADPAQVAEYRRIVGKIDSSIPVHQAAGNHDVQNVPTRATIANYVHTFGPDHYSFRQGNFVGIVLNSSVINSPTFCAEELAEQEKWLKAELTRAKAEVAGHIVVFQHHSWFLASPTEADQYFNIPLVRRTPYLALFHEFGVKYLFCGHYHRNAEGHDGDLTVVTTGPVGKPLDNAKSGLRVAIVHADRIDHRFYDFGDLPVKIELEPQAAGAAVKK